MVRVSLCGLCVVLTSLLAFHLFTPSADETNVLYRYVDVEVGEYAYVCEEAGQRYLVLARRTRVPLHVNPPVVLCARRAAAQAEVRNLLRDEDFPAVAWHGADGRYERIWRVSDGKLLWQRGTSN